MKKSLLTISILFLVFFSISSIHLRAEGVTLQGENIETSGETVDFSVSLSGNPGLSSIVVTLSYDRNALTAINQGSDENPIYATKGDFTNQGGIESNVSYKSSRPNLEYCTVIWFNAGGDVSSDGTLFKVRFSVNSDAETGTYPVSISYKAADTVNAEGERIAMDCRQGAVTVRRFEPTFFGSVVEGEIGSEVRYTVSVRDNPGIYGFQIMLNYDASVLKLNTLTDSNGVTRPEVSLGDIAENPFISSARLTSEGMSILWSRSSKIESDGALFSVSFTVTGAASSCDYPVAVRYDMEQTIGENDREMNFSLEDGIIRVLPSAKFLGVNLNITDDLKLQFFALTTNPDNTFFRLNHDGIELELTNKTYISPERGYRFVYKMDPRMMADEIDAELVFERATVSSRNDYSIAKYANDLYNSYSSVTVLMNLLANMLEYGAAAQKFTSHNLDHLANSYAWVKTYRTVFSEVTTDAVKVGTGDAGASLLGAALDLTDVVNIYYVVDATDDSDLEAALYRTVSGSEKLLKTEVMCKGRNYIRTDDLFAYEYDSIYRLSLKRNGMEIASNTFSVKSYVSALQNNTVQPVLSNLVCRLWMYGEAARAYPRN